MASTDVSVADPPGAAVAPPAADLEMSEAEYVPDQSDVDSDALSMDEEVVGVALQLSPPCSPCRCRKHKHRTVSSRPLPKPVDMDLSVEEGLSHRLFKTFREVWDDKLS